MNQTEKIKERLAVNQTLFDIASKDMEELLSFKKKFEDVSKKIRKLEEYYKDNWLQDVDNIKNTKNELNYSILGQDAIWNLLSDHYEFNKQMLKVLADELNK